MLSKIGLVLVATSLLLGSGNAWAKADAPAAEVAGQPSPAPVAARPAQPAVEETYAAREAQAKGLGTFVGGDVVVIGGSAVVIILIVVLILVII